MVGSTRCNRPGSAVKRGPASLPNNIATLAGMVLDGDPVSKVAGWYELSEGSYSAGMRRVSG
ncbi:MAG: hypothetical protein ACRDTF_15360, partial [Pseudonocardiaceae bacterium]